MAVPPLKVELVGMEFFQKILLAAYDLLHEVEDGDKTLLPDSVVESAARFRAELDKRPS